MMSPVRYPSSKRSLTAFSIFVAASSSPNWYRNIIAALKTCASGLALSVPAMSGALIVKNKCQCCMGNQSAECGNGKYLPAVHGFVQPRAARADRSAR